MSAYTQLDLDLSAPVATITPLEEVDHELPLDEGSWDEKRRVADGNALHHEEIEPTSLDEPRPADPNAAPVIASAANARSASGMTTAWFFAPPSAWTRLPAAAAVV